MNDKFLNESVTDKGFEIESIPIADLVNSIQRTLIIKQAEMREYGIGIKNIELNLKTVATAAAGAKISLEIPILGKIEFGSKVSEKSLQTTSLTLKPPADVKIERGIELKEMDETVAQSISSIIEGVKAANNQDSISLELEEASFEFNFILSGDSKISMIIESGFESELSNNLKIRFKKLEKIN